jgi:hypothetical protein
MDRSSFHHTQGAQNTCAHVLFQKYKTIDCYQALLDSDIGSPEQEDFYYKVRTFHKGV